VNDSDANRPTVPQEIAPEDIAHELHRLAEGLLAS
jgi:hypothetical protein